MLYRRVPIHAVDDSLVVLGENTTFHSRKFLPTLGASAHAIVFILTLGSPVPRNGGFWWRRLRESDLLAYEQDLRPWTIDQPLLLPPSVQDFVGEDHLARFHFGACARGLLDLGEIESGYASERGQPPFDPAMMTALLLYGYCHGVYSSRRIAKATRERVDFMSIVGLDPPDFAPSPPFRKRHLKALAGLSREVLKLCEQAGFVKLGHVALDTRLEDQGERLQAQER